MSLVWIIYLASVVDGLKFLCMLGAMMSLAGMFFSGLAFSIWERGISGYTREDAMKIGKRFFYGLLICAFVGVLLPSRNNVILMVSAGIGQRIFESEKTQGMIDPSLELLKAWIQKQTEELKKKKHDDT
jgi:hypothetical protein